MTIIDISSYFGCWPYWPIKITTLQDMISLMNKFEIDQTIVASTRSIFTECDRGNNEVVDISNNSAGRILSFAVINPRIENTACEELEKAKFKGMKGFRLYPQHHHYRLNEDPVLLELLSLGQTLKMPLMVPIRLILHWGLPQLDVNEISFIAKNFPSLKIVISGVNYSELRDAIAVMRKFDNVGFETSCLQMVDGIETLVKKIGVERVYMGTGMPLMYPLPCIYKIQKAQISDREKELILGENTSNLLAGNLG